MVSHWYFYAKVSVLASNLQMQNLRLPFKSPSKRDLHMCSHLLGVVTAQLPVFQAYSPVPASQTLPTASEGMWRTGNAQHGDANVRPQWAPSLKPKYFSPCGKIISYFNFFFLLLIFSKISRLFVLSSQKKKEVKTSATSLQDSQEAAVVNSCRRSQRTEWKKS